MSEWSMIPLPLGSRDSWLPSINERLHHRSHMWGARERQRGGEWEEREEGSKERKNGKKEGRMDGLS